jgi:hypothetical protein
LPFASADAQREHLGDQAVGERVVVRLGADESSAAPITPTTRP